MSIGQSSEEIPEEGAATTRLRMPDTAPGTQPAAARSVEATETMRLISATAAETRNAVV